MFGKQRQRDTATFTTSDWDAGRDDSPRQPVIALRALPAGPTFVLDEIRDCYGPKKWITVGASSLSDIRLEESLLPGQRRTVSRRHCRLCRTPRGTVLVEHCKESHNRTKVNRVRLHDGRVELSPGDVIRVGKRQLVALGAARMETATIKITAADPVDYVSRVVESQGTLEKAAVLLGVHLSTVSRWLRKRRFRV